MLFVLGFLVMGCGLIAIGIPPTAEEFWRIVFFIIDQYLLCSILVESGYSVFTPFPSGSDFRISICGCLVVFFSRIL